MRHARVSVWADKFDSARLLYSVEQMRFSLPPILNPVPSRSLPPTLPVTLPPTSPLTLPSSLPSGSAPVIDACGMAGGRYPGQGHGGAGADYMNTSLSKQVCVCVCVKMNEAGRVNVSEGEDVDQATRIPG